MRRPCLELLCVAALAGCSPGVGECDQTEALRLAYDEQGIPMFAGQALVSQGCAPGHCHQSGIDPALRAGAPHGLDFDVRPASTTPRSGRSVEDEVAAVARLEEDRGRVVGFAGEVWGQIASQEMPPWDWANPPGDGAPPALRAAYENAIATRFDLVANDEGTAFEPLPGLDTPEGREIVRNWIACGAPVVERVDARPPYPELDRFPAGYFFTPACERNCVGITWPAIYQEIIEPRCATGGCHTNQDAAGQLDLEIGPGQTLADVHARLLGADPMGSSCDAGSPGRGAGVPMLTAGEPDLSLLLMKVELSGEELCGSRMPLSGNVLSDQRLCVLREWIACGACPEEDGGACQACLSDPDRLSGCNLAGFPTASGEQFECATVQPCEPRLSL